MQPDNLDDILIDNIQDDNDINDSTREILDGDIANELEDIEIAKDNEITLDATIVDIKQEKIQNEAKYSQIELDEMLQEEQEKATKLEAQLDECEKNLKELELKTSKFSVENSEFKTQIQNLTDTIKLKEKEIAGIEQKFKQQQILREKSLKAIELEQKMQSVRFLVEKIKSTFEAKGYTLLSKYHNNGKVDNILQCDEDISPVSESLTNDIMKIINDKDNEIKTQEEELKALSVTIKELTEEIAKLEDKNAKLLQEKNEIIHKLQKKLEEAQNENSNSKTTEKAKKTLKEEVKKPTSLESIVADTDTDNTTVVNNDAEEEIYNPNEDEEDEEIITTPTKNKKAKTKDISKPKMSSKTKGKLIAVGVFTLLLSLSGIYMYYIVSSNNQVDSLDDIQKEVPQQTQTKVNKPKTKKTTTTTTTTTTVSKKPTKTALHNAKPKPNPSNLGLGLGLNESSYDDMDSIDSDPTENSVYVGNSDITKNKDIYFSCRLKGKYPANTSYVYYIKDKMGNFVKSNDDKGVFVEERMVVKNYSPDSDFVKVDENKYLKSKIFYECNNIKR